MKYMRIELLFALVIVCVQVVSSIAQQDVDPADKIRVQKIIGLGNKGRVYTPSFDTDVGRGINQAEEWKVIRVTYDTAPEWMDDLLVQFYVLSVQRNKETNRNAYSLFKLAVRYIDIERGRDHLAIAFLRPAAIKRYGEPVGVAAVITLENKVVAEISDEDIELPEKWWRNPLVTESKEVSVREGYLLPRSDTPWAVINPDDYEVIK